MKRKVIMAVAALLVVGLVGVRGDKIFVLEANAAEIIKNELANANEKVITLEDGQYHFYFADENYLYGAKIDGFVTKPLPMPGEPIVKVSMKDGKVEETEFTAFQGFPYKITTNESGIIEEENVITKEKKELVSEADVLAGSDAINQLVDIQNSNQYLQLTYPAQSGSRVAFVDKYNKKSYVIDVAIGDRITQIYKSPTSEKMYIVLAEIYDDNGKDKWAQNVYEAKLENGQIVKGNKIDYKAKKDMNLLDINIVSENGVDKVLQNYVASDIDGVVSVYNIQTKESKDIANNIGFAFVEGKFIVQQAMGGSKAGDVYKLSEDNLVKAFSDVKVNSGVISSSKVLVNSTESKYIYTVTSADESTGENGNTVIALKDAN